MHEQYIVFIVYGAKTAVIDSIWNRVIKESGLKILMLSKSITN